jgi:hypothetical protein
MQQGFRGSEENAGEHLLASLAITDWDIGRHPLVSEDIRAGRLWREAHVPEYEELEAEKTNPLKEEEPEPEVNVELQDRILAAFDSPLAALHRFPLYDPHAVLQRWEELHGLAAEQEQAPDSEGEGPTTQQRGTVTEGDANDIERGAHMGKPEGEVPGDDQNEWIALLRKSQAEIKEAKKAQRFYLTTGSKVDVKLAAAQEVAVDAQDRRADADHAASFNRRGKREAEEKAIADTVYRKAIAKVRRLQTSKKNNTAKLESADAREAAAQRKFLVVREGLHKANEEYGWGLNISALDGEMKRRT